MKKNSSSAFLGKLLSVEHDEKPNIPKKILYIATVPRTGSNFLCLELWRRGLVGCPWEYFNETHALDYFKDRIKFNDKTSYVKSVTRLRTGFNHIFSTKMFRDDFCNYYNIIKNEYRDSEENFVYLTRRDHVAQATSWARAEKSKIWAIGSDREQFDLEEMEINDTEISMYLSIIESQEKQWESEFNYLGISPLRLVYEDLNLPGDLQKVETLMGERILGSLNDSIPEIFRQTRK